MATAGKQSFGPSGEKESKRETGTREGEGVSEVKVLEVHMPFPQYLVPGLMNTTASYSGISSHDEHSGASATFQ